VFIYRLTRKPRWAVIRGGNIDMRHTWTLLALAPLLLGCGASEDTDVMGTVETWKAELIEADRAFNDATLEFGADGWVSFFSHQGSMVQEGVGEIRGLEAIRAVAETAFSDPSTQLTWSPQRAEVSSGGDLGYTVGTFESSSIDSTGAEVIGQGIYVSIWRRQPDGSWKVEMDLGNPTDA
jgi:ketosteroid isomerase-like protein